MMNINVLVDSEDDLEWLKYTLDSFIKVSRANFRFNICAHAQQFQGIVIAYGIDLNLENQKVISIPRINDYQPGYYNYIVAGGLEDSRIEGTSIPIFQKTFAPIYPCAGKTLLKSKGDSSCCAALIDDGIKLYFDLFYNSFIHLSCLEEWEYEKEFAPIQSYASRLKGMNMIYQKPVVNYLFAILENTLLLLSDESSKNQLFAKRNSFQICLTHDVDYVRKTASLRIKRTAFHLTNMLQNIKKAQISDALVEIFRSFRFLIRPCGYWQFEHIEELEETHNFRATFYLYAGVKQGQKMVEHIKRLVFDPGYDVIKEHKLKKTIKELTEKGWEVGLHGSYNSYHSQGLLLEEKKILEAISNLPVLSTRQHWLNLSIRNTWQIQAEAGLKADTTLGFNDWPGFRAGIANPFYPYDFVSREGHRILEVPMVLMDGALFDHCRMGSKEALERSLKILEEVKKFNGCAAINWHQRTPSSDYKWYWLYKEILTWIKENNGEGIPVCKTLETLAR